MNFFDRSNESVATPRQSLNEAGTIGRIAQNFAQPHYGIVHSMIKIHKGVARPKACAQFIPGNSLTRLFKKDGQNLKGLFGQFEAQTMLAQFERFEVNLEGTTADYFCRMDRFVHVSSSRCHEV